MSDASSNFLKVIQKDLPLENRPFLKFSQDLGISENDLLRSISDAKNNSQIRRYGAVLKHNKSGFTFNIMLVFDLPDERIDNAGKLIAEKEYVSHCYQRNKYSDWPYNLYVMVHARDEEEGLKFIDEIKEITGDCHFQMLKSLKEYKKTSLQIL